ALPRGDVLPAERLDVLDRGDEPGPELVRRRARLESPPERPVRVRAHLVRPPGLEQLLPGERDPEVRAEELVRRADEHVDAEGVDVDRAVRRVVNRVRPGERTGTMRQLDDAPNVRERADRVRGDGEGDDPRPRRELPLQRAE